jgi:hypothetical protein
LAGRIHAGIPARHRVARQWFGDSVALDRRHDIWLWI